MEQLRKVVTSVTSDCSMSVWNLTYGLLNDIFEFCQFGKRELVHKQLYITSQPKVYQKQV